MRNSLKYETTTTYFLGNEGNDMMRFSSSSSSGSSGQTGTNFLSIGSTGSSSSAEYGLNVKINSDGTIRDDKLNIIRVEIQNTMLSGDHKPYFEKTFLDDENIIEKISNSLPASLDNGVYMFFCVKPQIGAFKGELVADDLVQVQSAFKENPTSIVLKVNFKRALRPIYSLQSEYKRKRNNSMILHVFLFYKQNICDTHFTQITGINSFRFRSNSGRSTKPYTVSKKPKLENVTQDETYNIEFNDFIQNQNYPVDVRENTLSAIFPVGITPLDNTSKPLFRRIHPDQCFAFQNWECDNPDITFILLGNNLTKADGIKVYFVYNEKSAEAIEKKTHYSEKEYYVPCVKRLLYDADITCLPETGLTVDVVVIGNNLETPPVQKYTYLNIVPTTQAAFGVSYHKDAPINIHSLPKPIPPLKNSSLFYFPDRCDESEVIRYYENNRLLANLEDQSKRNILHYAIQLDFKDLTAYALQCGANVNQADINGFTPLHMAVYHDNLPIVKLLVNRRASLKSLDSNGNNPYHLAVELKRFDIINYFLLKTLVKCKANVKDKITPEKLAQVSHWLKVMDGKCTLYWRLKALPYLPHIIRLICTAALIEKPQFVHYNDRSEMYSIKVNHAKIMIKMLFPDSRKNLFRSWSGRKNNEETEDLKDIRDEMSDEDKPSENTWHSIEQISKAKNIIESDDDEEDLELIQEQFMGVDIHLKKNVQRSKSQSPEKSIL